MLMGAAVLSLCPSTAVSPARSDKETLDIDMIESILFLSRSSFTTRRCFEVISTGGGVGGEGERG